MSIKNNQENLKTDLTFPPYFTKDERERYYLIEKHSYLSPMKKNHVQLVGIDLIKNRKNQIVVTAFIRSTIEKPIRLKQSTIFLLNQEFETIAHTEVDFKKLGVLKPNTSVPWTFIFPKNNLIQTEPFKNESWSLAFKEKSSHRLDLSDMKEENISKSTKDQLEEIIKHSSPNKNELSLIGLSAKRNEKRDLEVTMLIQNGTINNLEIKQLPLKIYDTLNEVVAQGTFQLADLIINANTSKPISLIFPNESLLKENIDLTSWSIRHVK